MVKVMLDERSTGRKHARLAMYKVLQSEELPYACQYPGCGKGPSALPPTVPADIRLPSEELRQGTDFLLEVNHKNKVLTDVDPNNLELLCKPHHRETDSATEKGVSTVKDEHGYRLDLLERMDTWPDLLK